MNKQLFFLPVIGLWLSACSINKLQQSERRLVHETPGEKIYILSVLPINSSKSSSNLFLSTLIVSSKTINQQQLSAFIRCQTIDSTAFLSYNFFADTIEELDQNRFPVLFGTSPNDSPTESVQFSIRRKKISLNAKNATQDFRFALKHRKKQSFVPLETSTDSTIFDLEPISSQLTISSEITASQSSILAFHIIEHPDFLFKKDAGTTYFWLDFRHFDGNSDCLFFSLDKMKVVHLIHSSFPVEGLQFEESKITWLEKKTGSNSISIQLNEQKNAEQFIALPVQLWCEERVIGNGIVYML